MASARDASRPVPIPGVLDENERRSVELRFGVGAEQVIRDHVISHVLAAIGNVGTDDVVFFGGTALSRTHLVDVRLSEDIDLIARSDRDGIGDRIEDAVRKQLRRSLGDVTFTPRIRGTRHPSPSILRVSDTSIQIQLLSSEGYPDWPTEVVDIEQRYSDAPAARLRVLTPAAFVASKMSAWNEREAPRDLYDLWALAAAGKIDGEAADVFRRFGPYLSMTRVSFARLPTQAAWEDALSHQCTPVVTPDEAAAVVRDALGRL